MAKESKVKNENYIHIAGWMVNDLKLKGNDLIIYAIIYGFSQVENQVFSGSLQYLCDWTNSSKQGIQKNLKSLIEKGYIGKNDKYINGVKFCEYYATKFNTVCNKVDDGMQQSSPGDAKKLDGGMQQSCTNNIDLNNINNNISNNKEENIKEESAYSPINIVDKKREERMLKEQFEHLWSKYPRKVGKEQAYKSFKKYRLSGIFEDDMEKGLDRYLKYIKDNNIPEQYIKHGSTWFNQQGWNDEYEYKSEHIPSWFYEPIEEPTEEDKKEMEELLEAFN